MRSTMQMWCLSRNVCSSVVTSIHSISEVVTVLCYYVVNRIDLINMSCQDDMADAEGRWFTETVNRSRPSAHLKSYFTVAGRTSKLKASLTTHLSHLSS